MMWNVRGLEEDEEGNVMVVLATRSETTGRVRESVQVEA